MLETIFFTTLKIGNIDAWLNDLSVPLMKKNIYSTLIVSLSLLYFFNTLINIRFKKTIILLLYIVITGKKIK